jgi:hypothetical protein
MSDRHFASYALLNKLSKERQEILQNSLQLFDFYSECDDFNKWMREKSKVGYRNSFQGNILLFRRSTLTRRTC